MKTGRNRLFSDGIDYVAKPLNLPLPNLRIVF